MAQGFVGCRLGVVAIVLSALALLCVAPSSHAGEVVFSPQNDPPKDEDGWQAGTCNTSTCGPESPSAEFFETAAGHPPWGMTQFIVRHQVELLHLEPEVDMKTLRVDLPVGLSVNPGATPQCAAEHPSECAVQEPLSEVGESQVTVSPEETPLPPIEVKFVVYNLVPKFGQPARFGFTVEAIPGFEAIPPHDIFLEADVAWDGDYHEGFTIHVPKSDKLRLLKNRLVFRGEATAPGGEGFFITTPSTCFDPNVEPGQIHTYSTYARADSVQNPDPEFPAGSPYVESKIPPGTSAKGCDTIPFDSKLNVDPGTNQVDAPAGSTFEVELPVEPNPKGQETSTVRIARVTHPENMGLNPSAANGLEACTDAQFGRGTRNPVQCPAASKIGTVSVESPPLPEGPLTGNVYVGEQLSRDPESGDTFRIFVNPVSTRYGVDVRLVGKAFANAKTGQLTVEFDEPAKAVLRGGNSDNLPHGLPQVPFTIFRVDLDDGPRAALSSPPICGPNEMTSQMTPWSALFSGKGPATPASEFTLATLPSGAPCPKTMAERPFAPGFEAKPKSSQAKTFTPFSTHISRPPGQQELKGIDVTLPKGATAKLKGVEYCPANAIAAAENRAGTAEKANPTCPKSKIGVASVQAGTGSSPLTLGGTAYLAGPYEGAPLSVLVITPSVAGPFDLGNVLVRVPLFVHPETAKVTARTKSIPHVFGGAKLDIRSVFLNLNREDFTLNGTNCRKGATAGFLNGGGGDPLNPASFSAFPVSDPFRATGCKKLKFRPKLKIRLFGKTQRAKNPKLRAVLKARPGDANIARASVALPHALFLDQASLATVCTRVQFAADKCPKKSIYGRAKAFSPLLGKPLKGPVFLRSSDNLLPDMVAHLEGQVDIDLVGRIDSFRGGIRTTFDRVPDVPVTKFVMTLPGGKKGLLVNSTNLCAEPVKAIIKFKAQNGKKVKSTPKLRTPCSK